jgi:hypothetical protein
VPEGFDHPRWPEIRKFLKRAGIVLDPWQLEILRVSLMVRADGLWAAFIVGVCCPRQNGKNEILEARELVAACVLEEPLAIHSAHLADTSRVAFGRMQEKIDRSEYLSALVAHVWRSNGHEAIEFRNGARIRFRTRTPSSGRGFSAGLVKLDEAMYVREESEASIMYVVSAQPNPQIWFAGSAVDQTTMEDGLVFARHRARALAGGEERLAWFEWSLDYASPDQVEEGFRPELVAQTNPGYGIRISEQYVRAEYEAIGSGRGYAVERLGVGDWPDPEGDRGPISVAAWGELVDQGSRLTDPICLSFDVSPERAGAIAAAGPNEDGLLHCEIADARDGTAWIPRRLAELAQEHNPLAIVCDARGPGASLIHAVEEALLDVGYELELVDAAQNAQACGLLVDAVAEQTLRHFDDARIVAAIRGAGTRPLSDAWSWARRSSTVDISSLVAITLALWSAAGAPDTTRELVIY